MSQRNFGELFMENNKQKVIYTRKTYYVFLNIFLAVLYLVRYTMIWNFMTIRAFVNYGVTINADEVPIFGIVVFAIVMNLLGLLIPKYKVIEGYVSLSYANGWTYCFYAEILLDFMFLILSNYHMGASLTRIETVIAALINLIPTSFLAYILIFDRIYNNKKVYDIVIAYLLPSIIKGSKSGIIFLLMYYISIKVAFGYKIKWKRTLLVGVGALYSYPLLYATAFYIRMGSYVGTNLFFHIGSSINYLREQYGSIFMSAINLISYRVNAIDILAVKSLMSNRAELFSPGVQLIYVLKGIFTSSVVTLFFPNYAKSFGAVLVEKSGMPVSAGGIEPTLFGNIYFSDYSVLLCITYIIILLTFLLYIRKTKNCALSLYIILNIVLLIMTGLIQNLTLVIRAQILFVLFNGGLGKVRITINRRT